MAELVADKIAIAEIRPTLVRAIEDIRELREHLQTNEASTGALARSVESALVHLRYAQDNLVKLSEEFERIEALVLALPQQHAQSLQAVLQVVVQSAMQSIVQTVQAAKDADARATQATAVAAIADAKITNLQDEVRTSAAANLKLQIASRKQLFGLIGTVIMGLASLIFGLLKG